MIKKYICLFLLLLCSPCFAQSGDTTDGELGLFKPNAGSYDWATLVNDNFDKIDSAVTDMTSTIIYVDSTDELQPAINSLEAEYGGTIHIAPGIYDLEDTGLTISGSAPITIIGSGTGRAGMGTRIESSSGIDLITIGTSSTENDTCEINISNLRLYGDFNSRPSSGSGLKIINQSAGLNISNVYFDYNYVGIVIEAEGVDNSSYDNSVYSCTFKHNATAYIIHTIGAGGTNFCNVNQVTDSQFENNDLCISMTTVPGSSEIAHNYFKGCNFDTQQVTQKLLYLDGDVQNNRWVSCSFDGVDGYEMITIGPEAEHNQFVGCTFDCDINVDSGVENILFFPANYDRSIITNRAEDNSGVSQDMLTIFNEDGTVQQDTAILKLKHDDDGESNAKFLEMYDNAGADLKYSFGVDALLNGDGNVGISTTSPSGVLDIGNEIIYVDSVDQLQPAIDKLEAGKGGTIMVMAGTYTDPQIVIAGTDPIIIKGQGRGTSTRGTNFRNSDGDWIITIGNSSTVGYNESIKIQDIEFIGNTSGAPATGGGILVKNMWAGVFIDGCKFWYLNEGLKVSSEGTGNSCANIYVNNCNFSSNTYGEVFENVDGGTNNYNNWSTTTNCYYINNDTHILIDKGTTTGEIGSHWFSNIYMDEDGTGLLVDLNGANNCSFTNIAFDGVYPAEGINIDANTSKIVFDKYKMDCTVVNNGTDISFINLNGDAAFGGEVSAPTLDVVDAQIDNAFLSGALTLSNVGEAIYSPNAGSVVTESRGIVAAIGDTNDNGAANSTIFQVSQGETYGNLLTANKLLTVLKNGNVGVGTVAPTSTLDVEGTITVDQKIKAQDSGGIEFATDEGTTRMTLLDSGITQIDNIQMTNPGVGNSSTIEFKKTNDQARVVVTETEADKTTYMFEMADNPDSTNDKFLWKISDWKGDGGDWIPLIFSGYNTTMTQDNLNLYGKLNLNSNSFYTGSGMLDTVTELGTGSYTMLVDISEYSGTSSMKYYHLRITSAGTPDQFEYYVNAVYNYGVPVAENVAITGDWQTLQDGVKVKFNTTTGGTVGDAYSFRIVPGGGITFNDGTMYIDSNNVGIGTTSPQAQLHTTGGRIVNTTRVTSDTTLNSNNHIVYCDTDGGAIIITLPAGIDGINYQIINTGTSGNNVTIVPNGSELLNGYNESEFLIDSENLILTYEESEGWF